MTQLEAEQLAYNEIRLHISKEFLTNPPKFVFKYKKRPEDFVRQDLIAYYKAKDFYHSAINLGTVRFKDRFRIGDFFS